MSLLQPMKKPNYHKNIEDKDLFAELRRRVNSVLRDLPESRDNYIKIKAIILPVLYFGLYAFAMYNHQNYLFYIISFVLMGIVLVLIYLNLIHEAAHNNIYKTKIFNKLVLSIFDFVGANSYIWQKRHVYSHHSFPNVDGWDTDIEQSGLIKIYPHGEAKGIQKFQHKFFWFAYPLYLFNWMIIRDFKDFFGKGRVIKKNIKTIPKIEIVKLIIFKAFYIFYQIFVPIIFLQVSWKLAFSAWLLQVIVASIFALFVLLPLHPLDNNKFPLTDKNGNLPFGWLKHQLETTNDLSNNNWFIRHILGNFNYHVAHHLFPNISYVYYVEISDELERFSKEHSLNYRKYSLPHALRLHYDLLKKNAILANQIFEE